MNTIEINNELRKCKCFIGTFPKDKLPKIQLKQPFSLVMNTDLSTKPGEHWIAIYVKNDECLYFDSYGLTPKDEFLFKFLNKNKVKSIIYNPKQIQSFLSISCGQFCILFIKYMCKGYTFCKFINKFASNGKSNNENTLKKLYMELRNTC